MRSTGAEELGIVIYLLLKEANRGNLFSFNFQYCSVSWINEVEADLRLCFRIWKKWFSHDAAQLKICSIEPNIAISKSLLFTHP